MALQPRSSARRKGQIRRGSVVRLVYRLSILFREGFLHRRTFGTALRLTSRDRELAACFPLAAATTTQRSRNGLREAFLVRTGLYNFALGAVGLDRLVQGRGEYGWKALMGRCGSVGRQGLNIRLI